jgi:bifunctional UDP-N-acetylglucosamine pyrophosphorylase/glucosamine-1-phosphate N-acetyltransferase
MSSLSVVVLAAGLGTRMKSSRAKVLHRVCGRPMIEYPIALAHALGARRVIAVLGHQLETVKQTIDARFGAGVVEVALQAEQRGTGHALMQAAPLLGEDDGLTLVLSGDVPLLSETSLRMLVGAAGPNATALLTFTPPSPRGYGRVVRDDSGRFRRIVEEKDASEAERRIGEVNAGIYCGPTRFLLGALASLTPNNAQHELYLTDVLAQAATTMEVHSIECATEEVMGVNDRVTSAPGSPSPCRRASPSSPTSSSRRTWSSAPASSCAARPASARAHGSTPAWSSSTRAWARTST